ncbi:MAG: carboxypeptidase regulatory-like domain-containing protein [Acidobacteria bacterium]|nr:carboxypeptidase regulatory-like domain-containing protein [Acidobacteriota bacterium]
MSRSRVMFLVLGLAAIALSATLPAASQSAAPGIELTGTVKGADGKAMEGVAVSAKGEGSTVTTSVWTNQNGAYAFPALEAGRYQVWAQAIGFNRPVAGATVTPGQAGKQNFTLTPTDIIPRSLSTAEWMQSLPSETSFDRRMKMVVLNNCSNCHLPANWLEKHFDADSWNTVLDYMEKSAPHGDVPENSAGDPPGRRAGGAEFPAGELDANGDPVSIHTKLMRFYRKDLVEYLTRVAGPKALPLKAKPFARPTGVATQIVVTEYDLPFNRPGGVGKLDPRTGKVSFLALRDGKTVVQDVAVEPRNEYRSGSDWSWGTRDEHLERGTHDIAVGVDGNIYFGMNAMSSDPARGYVWYSNGRQITGVDVKAGSIKPYPGLRFPLSHGTQVDSKGNVWGSFGLGFVRLDVATGTFTEFNTATPFSRPYDLGVDRFDNAWVSQLALDRLAVVDGKTGEVKEVALPPLTSPDLRPEDIEILKTVGSWDHNAAPGQQGPRRMSADARGDYVYSGLYWAGGIAQIDARTKTFVKIHSLPELRWAQPYKPIADKNHMVWFSNSAADLLGQLNPTSGKITLYQLPTRGTNSRHLAVDDTTDNPTVWVPYTAAGKVARVQFRFDTSKN